MSKLLSDLHAANVMHEVSCARQLVSRLIKATVCWVSDATNTNTYAQ